MTGSWNVHKRLRASVSQKKRQSMQMAASEQEPTERGEEAVAMAAAELASQVAEADAAQVSVPRAEAAIHYGEVMCFFSHLLTFVARC